MDQHLGNHPYQPIREGLRRLVKRDGSFPPADATENDLCLTASVENYDMVVTGDIRVLSLLPGSFNDPIRCRLTVEPFENDRLQYDALSYMWGDPSVTQPITVDNNRLFPATVALQNALRHLRSPNRVRRLWVDAICINQRDIKERGHQVGLMKDIYARAKTVRVWIDVALSPGHPVVQRLLSLSSRSTLDDLGDDSTFWEPLIPLFQSPYWDRLWVQQELVFATQLEFHLRGVNIPGDSLMAFQHLILQKLSPSRCPLDPMNDWQIFGQRASIREFTSRHLLGWRDMLKYKVPVDAYSLKPNHALRKPRAQWAMDPNKWGPWLSTTPIYLLGALRHVRNLKVTDPRDRVYATLSLVIDYDDDGETPNYEQSLADKYTQLARLLVFKCNGLRFLADIALTDNVDPTVDGLPSWAPNWNSPGNPEYFHASFRAAGDIPMFSYPFMEDIEDGLMYARGFCYDAIRAVSPTRDCFRCPFSRFFTFSLLHLSPSVDVLEYLIDLASTLIEPALVKMSLSKDYFEESEKAFYLYILHCYAFIAPGLRMIDMAPYGVNTYPESQEDWASSVKHLHSFHKSLPSVLRSFDPEEISASIPQSLDQNQRFAQFITLLGQSLKSGNLILTLSQLGMVGNEAAVRAGDQVWILFGCPVPMILRRDGSSFIVVSPTYTSNIMDGQAVEGIWSPDRHNMWPEIIRTGYLGPQWSHLKPYSSGKANASIEVISLK